MQDVHTLLPIGSIIRDRYEVEALLGKGGFGAVYLVHDLRVKGNQFALKEVIDPKKQDRVHFLFEGEILKRLDHTALPRVYRAFEDEAEQRVYLLMDYIEGPNLERLRQRQTNRRFSLAETLRLLAPIVDAVIYLHNQQPPVLHRDIKPSNIIIPLTEGGPVLVDFGIAKEYDLDATTTAVRRLSPNYSAPEQYTQGTNPRTDVYGMAATCYVLLTGIVPVDAFYRITTLGNQGTDPLEPVHQLVPELPLSVAQAIERGMAIPLNDRFPTMQAFWDALQPHEFLASPEPITPLPEMLAPQALASHMQTAPVVNVYRQAQQSRPRRRRLLPILFAIIALAALLSGTLLGLGLIATHHPFLGSGASGTATTGRTVSPTHAVPTHAPQSTKPPTGATATVPVQPSPTAQPHTTPAPTYPVIQSTYNGTIHNSSANINGDMSLTAMQQQGANINGTLTLSNGLYGQAHLTGTVSSNNTLRFLVTPYTQYLPLLFEGQVNSNGSLSGTYCSVQGNQCDYAGGGYGTWQVAPTSSGSYGS
jgi:serine/threonine protein kinase